MKGPHFDSKDAYAGGRNISDYDIVRCIRSGCKWTSYLAKDKNNRLVTLTYFNKEKMVERYAAVSHKAGESLSLAEKEGRRLAEEYESNTRQAVSRMKGLGARHVGTTYGFCMDKKKNQAVVVSEYVPGIDLYYASGRLKPIQLICLFAQALDGLSFVHTSGFLHMNLKPSRICVDFEGERPNVMLTDFGFAIPMHGYKGRYNGTLHYMAPEVILEHREEIDSRSDLFSFGVIMYYCLCGHQPFGERLVARASRDKLATLVSKEKSASIPPSHFNPEVPPELDELVLGLLEKRVARRKFITAGNMLNYIYETWPEESHAMAKESTSTLVSYDSEIKRPQFLHGSS